MTSNAAVDRIDLSETKRNAMHRGAAEFVAMAKANTLTAHVLKIIGSASSYESLRRMISDAIGERRALAIVDAVRNWSMSSAPADQLTDQVQRIIQG